MNEMKKKLLEMLKEEMKGMMSEDRMGSDLAEKLKGKKMKKVTVASDSEEGLMEGLDKAEDMLEKKQSFKDAFLNRNKEDMEEESEDEMEDESEGCPMCGKMGCQKMACGGLAKKYK